jgi:hypothetical protein
MFDAVSRITIVESASAFVNVYDRPVAPAIGAQFSPALSQSSH